MTDTTRLAAALAGRYRLEKELGAGGGMRAPRHRHGHAALVHRDPATVRGAGDDAGA